MAGRTPRPRHARNHFLVRRCRWVSGRVAPTSEATAFAERDDVLARACARDAGRAVVSGIRNSLRQPVSAIGTPAKTRHYTGQDTTPEMLYKVDTMSMRIVPDEGKPSAAIEIRIGTPLPDYDLEQIDQPTPRDVDAILVSQGFRDLVDDARGILDRTSGESNRQRDWRVRIRPYRIERCTRSSSSS